MAIEPIYRITFADVYGDKRAEVITIRECPNNFFELSVGIPKKTIPNRPNAEDLHDYQRIVLRRIPKLDGVRIDSFGAADHDGDGKLDIYYSSHTQIKWIYNDEIVSSVKKGLKVKYLVLLQFKNDGYNFLSFILASSVVNCQSTFPI